VSAEEETERSLHLETAVSDMAKGAGATFGGTSNPRRPPELLGRFLAECRAAVWKGAGKAGGGHDSLGWAWGGAESAIGLAGQLRAAYDHPRCFCRLASALVLASCLPQGGSGKASPWAGVRPERQGYCLAVSDRDVPCSRFGDGFVLGLGVLLRVLGHDGLFSATDVVGQLLERAAAEDFLVSTMTGRAIPPCVSDGLAAQMSVRWASTGGLGIGGRVGGSGSSRG